MKTNILYKVMMLAMMAVVVMTFTACGGDSDDDIAPPVKSNYTYVEPYLEWGKTNTDVKSYMSGTGWNLVTDANYLVYRNTDRTIEQLYTFSEDTSELVSARVEYKKYTEDYWQWLIKETEKRYGITLSVEEKDATTGGCTVPAVIGGKQIKLTVMKLDGYMFVKYSLK